MADVGIVVDPVVLVGVVRPWAERCGTMSQLFESGTRHGLVQLSRTLQCLTRVVFESTGS